ncbi:MAG TPA: UDP-N-acetylmuramoyl-L-alanine--D-glutamate ligase [Polyangiaceae bacterium]|jgi:UDP-N-acetylmuramoylalanine--D-glutamate ligase|nr:UDP-N-acetylmuramoyl-L-alanine--D-glutamate ligase [Polyangiaceae bacterium]
MNLAGKNVIVVGLGRSGIAAARLCVARGASVVGTDSRAPADLPAEVKSLAMKLAAPGHDGVRFEEADIIVVSPGVPRLPALDRAERAGVLVIAELELAATFIDAPIIAVGGTNGKSTVTTVVAALFAAAGKRVFAGANLGTPLSDAVGQPFDVIVAEVSSFQLERAPMFHPRASILLNVTEDHLDRYSSFDEYAHAKGNAFVNQTPDDAAIVPDGDAVVRSEATRGRGRLITFGVHADYTVQGRAVVERATGERFSLEGADFHGTHNFSNAAAAVAVARFFGVGKTYIETGLKAFRSLGHRMALVTELDEIRYYDDSKATNVGAAVTALRGLSEERAVLVAGGRDKLGSYAPLVAALRDKGRAVVVIGEAADRIAAAIGRVLPVVHARDMADAVLRAQSLARAGDAVLLSPACSSFDMFVSYADRGDRFAEAVKGLTSRRAS